MRFVGGFMGFGTGIFSLLLTYGFFMGNMGIGDSFRIEGHLLYSCLILFFGARALGTNSAWAGMGLTMAAVLGVILGVAGLLAGGMLTAGVMAVALAGGVLAWCGAERP